MLTCDEFELGSTALLATDNDFHEAMKILRYECGWTILHAARALRQIAAYTERMEAPSINETNETKEKR